MRFAIIGAGALGTFYASRLYAAGHEVQLLARSDAAIAREQGFVCHSDLGRVHIPGRYVYADAQQMPPCDIVILATKSSENQQLGQLLPAVCAPQSQVLVLQNGLGVEDDAAAIVGAERVWGGLCFLCANKIAPGVVQQSDYCGMVLGRYAANGRPLAANAALRAVAQAFVDGGVDAQTCDDLILARWRKLVWNIPYNGLCTLLDCDTAQLSASAAGQELVRLLMQEVQAGAASCGRSISPDFIESMIRNTSNMGPYLPSMLIDRRCQRPLEHQHIFLNPLQAASCPLPHIHTLALALAALPPYQAPPPPAGPSLGA